MDMRETSTTLEITRVAVTEVVHTTGIVFIANDLALLFAECRIFIENYLTNDLQDSNSIFIGHYFRCCYNKQPQVQCGLANANYSARLRGNFCDWQGYKLGSAQLSLVFRTCVPEF